VVSISEPFIRRPVATVLLAIGIMLLGIVAYRQLAVASLPNVDLPIIRVSASLPGADPETVAASLATPLERQLGTISGLNQITSVNTLGNTAIMLQFELTKNVDDAARDVQAAINASVQNLPQDLPKLPTFFKANPAAFPIITLALTSEALPPARSTTLPTRSSRRSCRSSKASLKSISMVRRRAPSGSRSIRARSPTWAWRCRTSARRSSRPMSTRPRAASRATTGR
jgi:multidrug efflux pump subunit AcrB